MGGTQQVEAHARMLSRRASRSSDRRGRRISRNDLANRAALLALRRVVLEHRLCRLASFLSRLRLVGWPDVTARQAHRRSRLTVCRRCPRQAFRPEPAETVPPERRRRQSRLVQTRAKTSATSLLANECERDGRDPLSCRPAPSRDRWSRISPRTSRRLEPLGATSETPARCARAAGTSRDSRASARPVRGRQRARVAPPAAANGTRSRR